ncbi:hypothetical protein EDF56_10240 [Novosphingobium sp. PhB165]|uniref:alpha/beta hydrolase domain-containing protein n=1 Tax=Novosphingobium sp. PhB165 TaxID=2485105 RepID=UPI0010D36235|nr:alpha/beta hydrolase domain-containing protein [Novosphingobium sp. PhB165]TCM20380.1 hypothetical protein EDF56_10240 [Novosphingobium sp. PhB165]
MTIDIDLPVVRHVPGEPVLGLGQYELSALGILKEEFFISGTARSFVAVGETGSDGRWTVAPADLADFETRIVVLRPAAPEAFSGTVIVEWLNVSAGIDAAPDWSMTHREIVRSGHAYVAVSCQEVGVQGGPSMGSDMSLKKLNRERYESLIHPGDAFSYDIFTQVARMLRSPKAARVLGNLEPQYILGVGESQSATFLVTYINAADSMAKAFDGFLVHSRGTTAGPLSGQSIFVGERVTGVRLREDLRVPVIMIETESDLTSLGGLAVRQPDTDRLRTWEIAGTAHADNYLLAVGSIDSGNIPIEKLAAAFEPIQDLMGKRLGKPVNFAPQHHYVAQAALHRLHRWVMDGETPPSAERLQLASDDPSQLARDDDGNVLGGIRTPWSDVPTACNSGIGEAGTFSYLFGSSVPFDRARLASLYPGGEPQYLAMFEQSLDQAIDAGFILPADRTEIRGLASFGFRFAIR